MVGFQGGSTNPCLRFARSEQDEQPHGVSTEPVHHLFRDMVFPSDLLIFAECRTKLAFTMWTGLTFKLRRKRHAAGRAKRSIC